MDLPVNKIICFNQDTKERKSWFKAASFAHPAKMHLSLQMYLIERYTKPGDVILDPMAGSGTILTACALGRNVICVELEEKFVKMQKANWQKIKSLGPLMFCSMGEALILRGDARNLDGLLADKILFSPPFSPITKDVEFERRKYERIGRNPDGYAAQQSNYHPKNPNNISNLPYGEISAVISSPPYAEAHNQKGLGVGDNDREDLRAYSYLKTDTEGQIGNLPYKADAVITSPPYEGSVTGENGINWTKLKGKNGSFRNRTKEPAFDRYAMDNFQYSKQKDNIGNLKSENYLQAMFQVYIQCHRVLKETGLMVLVTKNFIREKKIVRLDLDTIKLCGQAGFKLIDRLYRKLTQQSFWRTIYHQKFPNVPKIEYEDVLVFQRAESRPDGLV